MTTAQAIAQYVEALPETAQQEVLAFVEFLRYRAKSCAMQGDDAVWFDFSLSSAMRGMEDESSPYTTTDLKESFR